ncbi:MAG: S8 family serine peptidase [Actinomycetota bacterium]|nr:S8 family serine peptidase [Actinomycetota bacterium]
MSAVVLTASFGFVASALPSAQAVSSRDISDPELQATIDEVAPSADVAVEVITNDDTTVARTVRRLGGEVTGSVDGEIVQALLPADKVDELAASNGADFVQAPRLISHLPSTLSRTEATIGTGPTVGNEVAITNADEWHLNGYTGAGVKIGIIDYFDMSLWDEAEHGIEPTVGNGRMFCKDTAAFGLCTGLAITSIPEGLHGVAVAEIVKDMAPGAELYIATVATVSDLQDAIDWFDGNGVAIVTRSLGAPYDGPGDGTGPLDAVVDHAASLGITWFNSAGNDGRDAYVRRSVPYNLVVGGYVDFGGGDTWLRLDGDFLVFDGVRWANDWSLPDNEKTDYSVEFWRPKASVAAQLSNDHWNPTTGDVEAIDLDGNPGNGIDNIVDADQPGGAPPLEAADLYVSPGNPYGDYGGVVFMRIRRDNSVSATDDTMEVALAYGLTELGYSSKAGSAAKPVVDSANPSLLAVGAVEHAACVSIADYSSQGPTTDGRVKPDITAPSGLTSTIYLAGFFGTSAASPTAAGFAAILLGAGSAVPATLPALVRLYTVDLGIAGPDNVFGAGQILLPPSEAPRPCGFNEAAEALQPAQRL